MANYETMTARRGVIATLLAVFVAAVTCLCILPGTAHAANPSTVPVDTTNYNDVLKKAYQNFGTGGVYITTMGKANAVVESYDETNLTYDAANGLIQVNPGKTGGSYTVRYKDAGYTSDGQKVDIVLKFTSTLEDTSEAPMKVYYLSGGLEASRANESGPNRGVATSAYVYVYKAGTTTTVNNKFTLMFRDLDVADSGDYNGAYSEGVEFVSGFDTSTVYYGRAMTSAEGHHTTNPDSDGNIQYTNGQALTIGTMNGHVWVHANHDCGSFSDSTCATYATSGAHFTWRGKGAGTTLGLRNGAPTPVSYAPAVVKKLENAAPGSARFSFQLMDASGAVLQTKSNDNTGAVAFSAIRYTEPGTYKYTIAEATQSDDRFICDTRTCTLTVVVRGNNEALEIASATYKLGSDSANTATFKNEYRPGRVTIWKVDGDRWETSHNVDASTEPQGNGALAGAKFTIYRDAACTDSTGIVLTVGVNGKAEAISKELSLGKVSKVYLKETTAPTGYKVLPSAIAVVPVPVY